MKLSVMEKLQESMTPDERVKNRYSVSQHRCAVLTNLGI